MSAEAALRPFAAAYDDRAAPARAWAARTGGKVVGYLDDMAPLALLEAAGVLPHRVSGAPDAGHKPIMAFGGEDVRAEPLEFVNSIFHRLTTGAYDFLDGLLIPYSRKAILMLGQRLDAFAREHPGARLPKLHVLDRAMARSFSASRYNRSQAFKLKGVLEGWSGRPIRDEAIARALKLQARKLALLGELQALRTAGRVGGVEALQILGAARILPTDEFNTALEVALPTLAAAPPRAGARLFVTGSPLDNARLYEVIEGCGALVVGEGHDWGAARWPAINPGTPGLAPIDVAADVFHRTPTAIVFPLDEAVSRCVDGAKACGAEAVVFNVFANDDAQIWEVPDCIAALGTAGIAHLCLKEQPYRLTEAAPVEAEVKRFLGSLGGRA